MPSSDDLTPEQLRAFADRAVEFRVYLERALERANKLGWPPEDELRQLLLDTIAQVGRLSGHCGWRAAEREQKRKADG